jgi:uncharacterized membrane protein
MVISEQIGGGALLRLLPNASATPAQTRLMVLLVGGVCLAIAVLWAARGAWGVLPFAGLEVGLLVYVARRACRISSEQQLIAFDRNSIRVESGVRGPERSCRLDRHSASIIVVEPPHPLTPLCIQLADRRRTVDLGVWLNVEDKELLLRNLKEQGLPVRARGRIGAFRA